MNKDTKEEKFGVAFTYTCAMILAVCVPLTPFAHLVGSPLFGVILAYIVAFGIGGGLAAGLVYILRIYKILANNPDDQSHRCLGSTIST